MNINDIVKQLRAVEKSHPVHRFSSKHFRIVPNPMLVAFIRMAGESRPWAIVFGRLQDKSPRLLVAPDGRNRIAVAEMCEEFALVLLKYVRAEGHTFNPITEDNYETVEIPQIWVPGDRHVEMFHYIEYAFWRVRKGDDRTQPLTAFARLAGWLFRQSSKRGQQIVMDAAKLLREHYVFPTDTVSLGNLTTANAWFQDEADLKEKRRKVREAGQQRVSPTLDPTIDKEILDPLLLERAKLLAKDSDITAIERRIYEALEPELLARWDALKLSYQILSNDVQRENQGVNALVTSTLESFVYDFQRVEKGILGDDQVPSFTPHPETDYHGSAAASNYYKMNAADNTYISQLIHDDSELQAASLAEGRSFIGTIVNVENHGRGNVTVPVWTIEVEIQELLRLRESDRFSLLQNPNSTLIVREVEVVKGDKLRVQIEWIDQKTKQTKGAYNDFPKSNSWVGRRLLFVPNDTSSLDRMKVQAVWKVRSGIGAWLTHGKAPAQVVDNVVDDITQLQGE